MHNYRGIEVDTNKAIDKNYNKSKFYFNLTAKFQNNKSLVLFIIE